MPATATQTVADRYTATFAGSKRRFETAKGVFPTGVTHDARMMDPFPVYITHAKGAHKWDVDGHQLTDYFVGHGSHLLGHCPDDVVKAVQDQMARGTHHGACHDAEIEWGQLVRKLIPSAERVRFTGSGTEATLMALRLSRLYTGKGKFLKFHGHFHGWHDYVTVSADPPYDAPGVPGVPDDVAAHCVAVPPNDLNRVEDAIKADSQIGAVILEPTGGHWGAVPIRGEFLKGLREICTRHGRLLIFDEVITGFRVSPGGAQAFYGITPDLTAMAKILAGGLPGGCLGGRADILAYIEPRPGKPKMKHPGTYNANPLSAAAGVAALTRVATGEPCDRANRAATRLRNKLNELFAARAWPWIAYGDFSMVRVLPGYTGPRPSTAAGVNDGLVPFDGDVNKLDGPKNMKLYHAMRQTMLLNGVDWWGFAGMTCCDHTDAVVDHTVTAFEASLEALTAEGLA
ncbi:glutamate-1-semialdehyde -aminomutase : Glutamate-1-semialdehyde 2,1-aminomutase, putative OS=Planctomyces maris DSM 8797 GN=PM8797T_22388 PE=3 SV=1: Aminotran_3 [Gemmata massiliana]|uniref:Glutamate-1-semialdehyde 2,1-aminomutase n=1 Tax=Gemmata massiliana TaxID=1210884 RepID=A0A6P2CZN0_9BACT|nr:aminotransferase class III-fold pyridoxal phosphate-dependent enzyme [Gemmata massiliana]VTR94598.1 glutamate-1-semialdehyde -aminomutase : Glutamate-1-semialdehyde 2,1-aminomutase, putative OS=Planctomyces maris DSM 8797 GN=PM8797T_22388 PE=3 SV=1: Aminotran_3 [Gemmata massiliana]